MYIIYDEEMKALYNEKDIKGLIKLHKDLKIAMEKSLLLAELLTEN